MPNAEILSIGTELLLGDVLDTNSQFISQELTKLGINCFYRTTVGDNKERIKNAIFAALSRAQILITTGGLGPTADDLTCESLAELFGTSLVLDKTMSEKIESLFSQQGIKMPPSNYKQALQPIGAKWLPNPIGSAPGIIWIPSPELLQRVGIRDNKNERLVLAFPGVPTELYAMWHQTAAPLLEQKYACGTIWSCELKHYGIGESALAEMFNHLLSLNNPTIAPYAGHGECRLRVTAKASSQQEAMQMASPIIEEIKKKSGTKCYGENADTLQSVVGKILVSNSLTISVAESCTGGLVSKRLTDIAGSSRYIKLNVITYANESKQRLLGVTDQILNEFGAVSEQCAQAMAVGIRQLAQSHIGLSITGIAGPEGGNNQKPVGLIYIGLAVKDTVITKSIKLNKNFSRVEIRHRAANEALNLVRLYLIDSNSISVAT